jgi:CubicO group peptidase (beta-lactamase class C family)
MPKSPRKRGPKSAPLAKSRTVGAAHRTSLKTPIRKVGVGKIKPGGFSPERLARIPLALQQFVDKDVAIGILTLLYRRGQIAHVHTLGYQDRETKRPMNRDAIFRLASMTKPVTCVAALTLIEQGKMGLYDPIEKWIPEFAKPLVLNRPDGPLDDTHPAPRGITVLDLLTHRSGLSYAFMAQGPIAAALQRMPQIHGSDMTFDEWLRKLSAFPLVYDPGSRWNYGTSHDLLGALIQRVSGQPFADYMKRAIFDPLGMADTGFSLPKEKQGRLAAIYGYGADGTRTRYDYPISPTPQNFVSGGGGLVSTADDYLKFARMLLGKGRLGDARILSRPSVALMITDWLTPEERRTPAMGNPDFWASQGFGLGLSITDNLAKLGPMPYASVGTFTWAGATGVWWQADPVEDMVALYFVQNMALGRPAPRTAMTAEVIRQGMAAFYAPMDTYAKFAYEAIDD